MKTKLIIPGIFVLGLAAAPMVTIATPNNVNAIEISFTQEKEKVKIEKDRLPEPVKEAIKKDGKTKDASIKEAWQMMGEDGKIYYAVKFDHEGKEMSKKYDANGNEKKD
ncbi:hypothetical protein A33Q_1882 [Indibacter alkaliphilus LW1]|uniref:PepSY domain-containing protein n=1 Tax=Indibacter alkaliphilus (strain CCUG 57479 / KCTC 22604 / LW1) TaxID=1189612 RepID=S2DDH5_INDAL|nr:hypothetical protein [Indibacter alkaliphilus]EOZ96964.1 hypothetical protein A33Q_1882 [Indibacter alkaliphilus LW1]